MRQEVAASTGRQWMILVMAARLKKSNPGARVSGCGKLGVALRGVFWSCGNQDRTRSSICTVCVEAITNMSTLILVVAHILTCVWFGVGMWTQEMVWNKCRGCLKRNSLKR